MVDRRWLKTLKVGVEVALDITNELLDPFPRYMLTRVEAADRDSVTVVAAKFSRLTGRSPLETYVLEMPTPIIRANVRRHHLIHLVRTNAQPSRLAQLSDGQLETLLDVMAPGAL